MNVELKVTPDKYLPHRYAGASGDFNPIHIDHEFAKQVGLPGEHPARALLDGPGGARHATAAGGDPRALQAALGAVPRHGLPRAGDHGHRLREGGARRLVCRTVAEQGGNQIIRNAEAELQA